MKNPLKFAWIAIAALLLPGIVTAVSLLRSGESFQELIEWLPSNWAMVALPQIFVVILARLFPRLRSRFATRALILLTVLFLLFAYITSFDANGALLWIFYFVLSILLLVVLALLPSF
ncbi:hypothetical protein [Rhodanobacter sp. DHG33]|uniref:hypothetical protein n=1 Tax=Rhodanobacter sp. DHG33 TaxID=2775921 RepID=UPI00177D9579|nr:hypothetical protein [Rhodanobacter sp. DHG33]MBD8897349.1 hypothetical protein [Rhodanobacter sp. DHG33]